MTSEPTPEMIEAGLAYLSELGLNMNDGRNDWLSELYARMKAAHPLAKMVREDEEQGLYDDERLPKPEGMTEALVEKVARAMSDALNAGKPPIVQWDRLHRDERELYETAARAAIAALSTRSEGQVTELRLLVEESLFHLRNDRAAESYHHRALAALASTRVEPDGDSK